MKKKNILIVVLVIIIVALIVALLFATNVISLNKKTNSKNTTTEETKKETSESLDINSDLVTDLMTIPHYTNDVWLGSNYSGYFYNENSYDINTISNKVKILIAIRSLGLDSINVNYSKETDDGTFISIPEDVVKESYYKIFGNEIEFKNESLDGQECGYAAFKYNSTTKAYEQNMYGCGGTMIPFYETKTVEATKYNDRIEIIEKMAYIEFDTDENSDELSQLIYTDSSATNKIDTISSEDEIKIDNYLDKLDSYKYTFKKDGNNYYLYYIEKII